jgi:hypothetical protein
METDKSKTYIKMGSRWRQFPYFESNFLRKVKLLQKKIALFSKNRKAVQCKILLSSNFFEPIDGILLFFQNGFLNLEIKVSFIL